MILAPNEEGPLLPLLRSPHCTVFVTNYLYVKLGEPQKNVVEFFHSELKITHENFSFEGASGAKMSLGTQREGIFEKNHGFSL